MLFNTSHVWMKRDSSLDNLGKKKGRIGFKDPTQAMSLSLTLGSRSLWSRYGPDHDIDPWGCSNFYPFCVRERHAPRSASQDMNITRWNWNHKNGPQIFSTFLLLSSHFHLLSTKESLCTLLSPLQLPNKTWNGDFPLIFFGLISSQDSIRGKEFHCWL